MEFPLRTQTGGLDFWTDSQVIINQQVLETQPSPSPEILTSVCFHVLVEVLLHVEVLATPLAHELFVPNVDAHVGAQLVLVLKPFVTVLHWTQGRVLNAKHRSFTWAHPTVSETGLFFVCRTEPASVNYLALLYFCSWVIHKRDISHIMVTDVYPTSLNY